MLTTRKKLTAQALACGYYQVKHYGPIQIKLWKQHTVYHVRAHDFETGKRRLWETFYTLAAARRYYNNAEALLVAKHNEEK